MRYIVYTGIGYTGKGVYLGCGVNAIPATYTVVYTRVVLPGTGTEFAAPGTRVRLQVGGRILNSVPMVRIFSTHIRSPGTKFTAPGLRNHHPTV